MELSSHVNEPKAVPKRCAPFDEEPGFYEPAGLWFYGNVRLLDAHLACISKALWRSDHLPSELNEIEVEAERLILDSRVMVCGVHSPAHQRVAVVPLRWGSPRIMVFSGGFLHHLGEKLDQEPFRAARLWRYACDPATDLAISRRAPDKAPTFASCNPAVDRLIEKLVTREFAGVLFGKDPAPDLVWQPPQPSLFAST